MSWGAVAVAGASVVSGYMGKKSADKASKQAAKAEAAELEFAREQYEDWKATYGPLEENLASYYSNVSPELYAAQGLEAYQQEFEASMARLDESLAQRGIGDSPIAISLRQQAGLEEAEAKAEIRRDAPRMAAEDKTRFLQIGMGQSPAQSLQATLANQAQSASQYALASEQAAGRAVGSAITTAGTALSDYLSRPTQQTGGPAETSYTLPAANIDPFSRTS